MQAPVQQACYDDITRKAGAVQKEQGGDGKIGGDAEITCECAARRK